MFKLTEMTQSATGFLRALSAVSLSLVRSIAVTCSMLNTFSSSMYITYNNIRDDTTAEAFTHSLHNRTLCLALQEGFAAKARALNNAGADQSSHNVLCLHMMAIASRFAWSRLSAIPLCPLCPMASVPGHKRDWIACSGQMDLRMPDHGNAWILGRCFCSWWPSVFQRRQKKRARLQTWRQL